MTRQTEERALVVFRLGSSRECLVCWLTIVLCVVYWSWKQAVYSLQRCAEEDFAYSENLDFRVCFLKGFLLLVFLR